VEKAIETAALMLGTESITRNFAVNLEMIQKRI